MNSSRRHEFFLDARLHLLDRQVLDRDGVSAATVDDLELVGIDPGPIDQGAPPPRISAICSGTTLATRIFGGRAPSTHLGRIEWVDVANVSVTIELSTSRDEQDCDWQERWVRNHIIGRIPGGRHAPE
ncbi:hypothetical protein HQO39_08105 [Rhodococcus fascians]|nr:hypothetical protein [Rhodococcus fascians]